MSKNLYTKEFGSVGYDGLIAGTTHPIDYKSVTLKAGQGIVGRGTVLGLITASGLAVPVDSAAVDGSQTADSILTDAVDTGDDGATEDVVTVAYKSGGPFKRQALIFGGDDTAADHEDRLREIGIYLTDTIPY
jgi:hypothetical protein